MITGEDAFEKVISGIRRAVEANLNPVKINTVLLKGINDNEVWSIVDFAERNSVILQLIELESAREDRLYRKHHSDILK